MKYRLVVLHVIQAYEGVEVQSHIFIVFAVHGKMWSDLCVTPGNCVPSSQCGRNDRPYTGLDLSKKRRFSNYPAHNVVVKGTGGKLPKTYVRVEGGVVEIQIGNLF